MGNVKPFVHPDGGRHGTRLDPSLGRDETTASPHAGKGFKAPVYGGGSNTSLLWVSGFSAMHHKSPCPEEHTQVTVALGRASLNMRLHTPSGETKEISFKVTRMRCSNHDN